LVIVASYLGLSALLAVSFFQSRAQSQQQYTYEALDKALTASLMPPEAFDGQFSKQLPGLKSVTLPTLEADQDSQISRIATFFQDEQVRQGALYDRLQESWSILRVTAATLPQRLRDEAVNIFRSSSEGRSGGREAAEHFTKLILWHQQSSQESKDTLSACSSQATRLASGLSQVFENFRRDLQVANANATTARRGYEEVVQSYLVGSGGARIPADYWESAFRACRIQSRAERVDPPARPPFGASLGVIGEWAGWLLRAESMPVVIIVGLVGFSLLGATVSRVVRRQLDAPSTGFTLDDLLLVIAGGTTAAFVIFLAAYGGLAVLGGGTTTDPNPYVVFVTCLVGAVYSEDVWQWARQRVLSNALDQNANNKLAGTQIQTGAGTGGTGGTGGTEADERLSIGKDLDGLASEVLKVRKAVADKMAAVDEAKRLQVEAISTSVDEIEKKIVAAQDGVRDLALPIDKIRVAQTEAKTAAAQFDDLTTKLQAI
jgi:xanthosine utilization system XapX-like protein